MSAKWIELMGDDGKALTAETCVSVDNDDVDNLRKKVKEFCDKDTRLLQGLLSTDLLVYESRKKYDAKEGPLGSRDSLQGRGDCGPEALIVQVPRALNRDIYAAERVTGKKKKTLWTTTALGQADPSTSRLLEDGQTKPSHLTLDAGAISGFGVYSPRDKLHLFCRTDVVEMLRFLQDDVIRDGRNGWILGPPGSGKSATAAAFALSLDRSEWTVTWIHLQRESAPFCVRLEVDVKKSAQLDRRYLEDYDMEAILNEVDVNSKHIVFLDGVTVKARDDVVICNIWVQQNRANRRLVVVTSMPFRGKAHADDDRLLRVKEHVVSSWSLDEYLEAVRDDEVFHNVRVNLDASMVSSWKFDECLKAVQDDDILRKVQDLPNTPDDANDSPIAWRESMVRSKYYFAGGSARFMFSYNTADVVALLKAAISSSSDVAATADGTIGERSSQAINRLFGRSRDDHVGIISKFACSAIAMFAGPTLLKRLASVLGEDMNPAVDGWFLEMCFFACIRKTGVPLYDNGETIYWPHERIVVVDPKNLPALPNRCWLKPQTFNQGGYDAVYIDQAQKLVRFVQVTRAQRHRFDLGFFYVFLCSLRDSTSSFEVQTLEIFFVVEREVLHDFEVAVGTRSIGSFWLGEESGASQS